MWGYSDLKHHLGDPSPTNTVRRQHTGLCHVTMRVHGHSNSHSSPLLAAKSHLVFSLLVSHVSHFLNPRHQIPHLEPPN